MDGARDDTAERGTQRGIGRPEPEPEDLTARARIRDAALKHFTEAGFAKATIREIARTAGVSPGLVRHHFGSKEDLRDACDAYVLRAFQRFNDQTSEREDQAEGGPVSVADRHALDPFQRYLVNALRDGASVAVPMFDEMVKTLERWLELTDVQRAQPPRADRRTRAALMVAQSLGVAAFHEHLSRAMGVDIFSADVDKTLELAMHDIYTQLLVGAEGAAPADDHGTGAEQPSADAGDLPSPR
ncbi:helix-turn-helix domain-containing protein [Streptomyces sp. NPDC047315]|uniref:TetR/AcrR family transcriptional regulator n=1 Tax=Streptomyces sp. NPDC047315 TaxID=3155142 RepID=UPI0033D4ACDB